MKKTIVFFLLLFVSLSFTRNKPGESILPGQVDLSTTKYFPPVGNQGNIGACDWFAAVYYQMTYFYNKQYNRAASPENTFSPKFGYNILNNAGVYPFNIRLDDVYKFVQKHGAASIADFPYDMAAGTGYTQWCINAEIWRKALPYRIEGYQFFTYNNTAPGAHYSFSDFNDYLKEIKKRLSEGEVLVFQSNTDPEKCSYKTVADDPSAPDDNAFVGEHILCYGNNGPDHTMAMAGYNDQIWVDLNGDRKIQDNEKGAFKIADSFGLDYIPNRNKGFFWIPFSIFYSSVFQYRINRMFIRNNYQPELICTVTLNVAERDKIKFRFGWSVGTNPENLKDGETVVFDPYGLGYEPGTAGVSLIEGGNFAFDGGEEPCDGSFTFDLSDISHKEGKGYYYLKISNSGARPLYIKKFEITDSRKNLTISDNGLPYKLTGSETFRFLGF